MILKKADIEDIKDNMDRKPFELPRTLLRWEMHYACNYRCSYCYFFGTWHRLAKKNCYPGVQKWKEAYRNIFKKYGSCHIHMTGGEPFTYPSIFELIPFLLEMHTIGFDTNLSMDPGFLLKKIKDPDKVQICPAFHPEFAEIEAYVDKLKMLRDAGFYIGGVNYVAYPMYLEYLDDYKEKIEKNGFQINIMPFRGECHNRKYPEGYTKEEKELIKYKSDNFKESEPTQGMMNWYDSGEKTRSKKICRMGQIYAKIFPDGSAYRCCMVSEGHGSLGNIIDNSFSLSGFAKECLNNKCICWAAMIVGEEERWLSHWKFQSRTKSLK